MLLASPAEAQQERLPNGEEVLLQTILKTNLPNTPRYQCNWSTLAFERNLCLFQIRKRGMRCRSSNPRVVKTIRLRRAGLEPWLYQTNIKVPIRSMTNLAVEKWLKYEVDKDKDRVKDKERVQDKDVNQVVHLVRDPRGILNSVSKRSVQYIFTHLCL